jgi:predicted ATP-dependent protease
VIIPEQNVRHLMLRPEIIDAVKQGVFRIYAVHHAYQALELLLSKAMGELDIKGKHPKDSIMGLVLAQLKHWHKIEDGDKPKKKKAKKIKKKSAESTTKQE